MQALQAPPEKEADLGIGEAGSKALRDASDRLESSADG